MLVGFCENCVVAGAKEKEEQEGLDWLESLKYDRFSFNIQIMISSQCRFWVGKSVKKHWTSKGHGDGSEKVGKFSPIPKKDLVETRIFQSYRMNNLWSHEPWSTCELPLDGRSIQDRKAKKKRTKDFTAIGWNFWKEVEFGNNNCKSLSRWWFQRFFIFTST